MILKLLDFSCAWNSSYACLQANSEIIPLEKEKEEEVNCLTWRKGRVSTHAAAHDDKEFNKRWITVATKIHRVRINDEKLTKGIYKVNEG